jgi:hypothetical protein
LELADRYGVSKNRIWQYASKHKCFDRRKETEAREEIRYDRIMAARRAEAPALEQVAEGPGGDPPAPAREEQRRADVEALAVISLPAQELVELVPGGAHPALARTAHVDLSFGDRVPDLARRWSAALLVEAAGRSAVRTSSPLCRS